VGRRSLLAGVGARGKPLSHPPHSTSYGSELTRFPHLASNGAMHPRALALALGTILAATLAATLAAQETPTEREAARDVIRKMDALEQSLDVPGFVSKLTGPNAARDAVVARATQLMQTDLLALGDDITRHPEIGFTEVNSVRKLTDYLKAHDFDVEVGVAGLPTAFVARYRKNAGAPNLGVILEYDALRGTKGAFHGDQHSTQGPIGIAAAVAMPMGPCVLCWSP